MLLYRFRSVQWVVLLIDNRYVNLIMCKVLYHWIRSHFEKIWTIREEKRERWNIVNENIFPFPCKEGFLCLTDWVERFLFHTLPSVIFLTVHILGWHSSVPYSSPKAAILYLAASEILDECIATLTYSGLITTTFQVAHKQSAPNPSCSKGR